MGEVGGHKDGERRFVPEVRKLFAHRSDFDTKLANLF
jgi:hypothetical protein